MSESTRRIIRDYGLAVGVAAVLALGIRFFWVEAYRIPTGAMRPALEAGDTIFVHKSVYGLRSPITGVVWSGGNVPSPGEVVVFEIPDAPDRDAIKRIVARAGQTVEVKRGRVWIDGKSLEDPTMPEDRPGPGCGFEKLSNNYRYGVCFEQPQMDDVAAIKIPIGSVFVLGDLRVRPPTDGSGIKAWGVVPITSIKAQARWVWLAIDSNGSDARRGLFSEFHFSRMFRRIP